jgi:hypothetical protein
MDSTPEFLRCLSATFVGLILSDVKPAATRRNVSRATNHNDNDFNNSSSVNSHASTSLEHRLARHLASAFRMRSVEVGYLFARANFGRNSHFAARNFSAASNRLIIKTLAWGFPMG